MLLERKGNSDECDNIDIHRATEILIVDLSSLKKRVELSALIEGLSSETNALSSSKTCVMLERNPDDSIQRHYRANRMLSTVHSRFLKPETSFKTVMAMG